jgi:hypothetical protein
MVLPPAIQNIIFYRVRSAAEENEALLLIVVWSHSIS